MSARLLCVYELPWTLHPVVFGSDPDICLQCQDLPQRESRLALAKMKGFGKLD